MTPFSLIMSSLRIAILFLVCNLVSPIQYWQGVMQSNSKPFNRWGNKPLNFEDHTNYRWRLDNPYISLLDNVYVAVPFSKVSVTTGENPIYVSGASDPFIESFDRSTSNKTEKKPEKPIPFTWGSLFGGKLGTAIDAGINAAKFIYKHG